MEVHSLNKQAAGLQWCGRVCMEVPHACIMSRSHTLLGWDRSMPETWIQTSPGLLALMRGQLLGRQVDMWSSEPTWTLQRMHLDVTFSFATLAFSFVLNETQFSILSQILICTYLSVQENEFMRVPICPRRKLYISQHCSILHAACRNYKGRIKNKNHRHCR